VYSDAAIQAILTLKVLFRLALRQARGLVSSLLRLLKLDRPAGAREFFRLFAELLEPGEFNITASFSEGEHVCMYGKLRHRSRTTGRDFPSNWALICRVQQGRLSLYHFYEDTAALEAAIA